MVARSSKVSHYMQGDKKSRKIEGRQIKNQTICTGNSKNSSYKRSSAKFPRRVRTACSHPGFRHRSHFRHTLQHPIGPNLVTVSGAIELPDIRFRARGSVVSGESNPPNPQQHISTIKSIEKNVLSTHILINPFRFSERFGNRNVRLSKRDCKHCRNGLRRVPRSKKLVQSNQYIASTNSYHWYVFFQIFFYNHT